MTLSKMTPQQFIAWIESEIRAKAKDQEAAKEKRREKR